jgi:phosphatidylglycerol:prolipoprotein diacylglycerol transferase
MYPKLITLGSFFLPSYGVLVALGFFVGLWFAARAARREGLDPEAIANLSIYSALCGLAGAKLMMFFLHFDYYREHPRLFFSLDTLLSAGVYYGGFLGALPFAFFYIRRQKLPWLPVLDVLAPALAAGHAVGRVGCFLAGCCWGSECSRAWAVTFTSQDAHGMFGTPLNVPLHPAQLYEAALTGLVAWALLAAAGRPHAPGRIFSLYLVLYSAARFAVEFTREHQEPLPFGGPITFTQWISVALFGTGLALLARMRGGPSAARRT